MAEKQAHGSGDSSPPIAGDILTFPSDAELSKTLVASSGTASLSTLTSDATLTEVSFPMSLVSRESQLFLFLTLLNILLTPELIKGLQCSSVTLQKEVTRLENPGLPLLGH